MLTVNSLTKDYGRFTALRDISLSFDKGVHGLLAPNGAGKTTLIKLLTTLLFPTRGEILWDGTSIHALGAAYRDLLGYLPQQFGYYKHRSPRQFLRYLAALKGMDPKRADARIEALIDLVALRDVIDQKMRKFSGGMIQRVGIAQAMLNDPRLLILDEPTSGLDPKERVRFRNILHGLAQDRIVILSTHIVSDVETIADRVVMIRDRRVHCDQPPAQLCKELHGRLFEAPMGTPLPAPHIPLSDRQTERGAVLRFYSEHAMPGAHPVEPGLEDVFLYVYRDAEGAR